VHADADAAQRDGRHDARSHAPRGSARGRGLRRDGSAARKPHRRRVGIVVERGARPAKGSSSRSRRWGARNVAYVAYFTSPCRAARPVVARGPTLDFAMAPTSA
jgi:hypothetical protein